eukprot:2257732-Amphidinium_carterae.1
MLETVSNEFHKDYRSVFSTLESISVHFKVLFAVAFSRLLKCLGFVEVCRAVGFVLVIRRAKACTTSFSNFVCASVGAFAPGLAELIFSTQGAPE